MHFLSPPSLVVARDFFFVMVPLVRAFCTTTITIFVITICSIIIVLMVLLASCDFLLSRVLVYSIFRAFCLVEYRVGLPDEENRFGILWKSWTKSFLEYTFIYLFKILSKSLQYYTIVQYHSIIQYYSNVQSYLWCDNLYWDSSVI